MRTTITYLTTIQFGHGVVTELAEYLDFVGLSRPLLVTDSGLVARGLVDRVMAHLPGTVATARFDGTPSNPTEDAVADALERYRAHRADGLIALGGGSSMDLAKAVALLATHDGPLEGYAAILGGVPRIGPAVAPVIAVPTTAGTGSEVGRGALITLRDGRKLGFVSPHLIPRMAVCDPDLTLELPAALTAATGMDALTHCIETYLSPKVNPPAEAIALDGAARAATWLRRAVTAPDDPEARWQMMMASLQGGMTFQKGLGAVHSMSHALGGLSEPVLHHGTLNAVTLPPVLRFNASHAEGKYAALAAALGLAPEADLARAILDLNRELGLPENLRAMGVPDAVLPTMVARAMADHCTATNPRPAGAEDFQRLFDAAMDQRFDA